MHPHFHSCQLIARCQTSAARPGRVFPDSDRVWRVNLHSLWHHFATWVNLRFFTIPEVSGRFPIGKWPSTSPEYPMKSHVASVEPEVSHSITASGNPCPVRAASTTASSPLSGLKMDGERRRVRDSITPAVIKWNIMSAFLNRPPNIVWHYLVLVFSRSLNCKTGRLNSVGFTGWRVRTASKLIFCFFC